MRTEIEELEIRLYRHYERLLKDIKDYYTDNFHKFIKTHRIEPIWDDVVKDDHILRLEAKNIRLCEENARLAEELKALKKETT